VFVLALLFWQTAFDVDRIDINGLHRLKPDAVKASIGMKEGTKAGKTQFEAACRRLMETGLFASCNWKYVPVSQTGVVVAIDVTEFPAEQTVRFHVPGAGDAELWNWLRANEPLVQPEIPASDEAVQFYAAAVQRYLKKDVAPSVDTNLQTKETTIVFRPAGARNIESVKFEGAQAISAATLEAKLEPIAKGTPSTEYDVKRLLNENIRPLYEELGRLDTSFPSVKTVGAEVTVQVAEGPVFRIGKIVADGAPMPADLRAGEIANWRKITDAFETQAKALRNQGHLEAKYSLTRNLNRSAGTVDVKAEFSRGPQFTFGSLKLDGLNISEESAVRSVWTLKSGAPMNEGYVDEFIKAAFAKLGNEFSGVATQIEPRDGNIVDVAITFRKR
jgi:outer membrane protein assembly factor BamA